MDRSKFARRKPPVKKLLLRLQIRCCKADHLPTFEAAEEDIWNVFWPALRRVFPDLSEDDIENRYLFRERFVQPVPVLNYSDIVPDMQTSVDGLLLANIADLEPTRSSRRNPAFRNVTAGREFR